MSIDKAKYERLMGVCQKGYPASNIHVEYANNTLAECYGAIGALLADVKKIDADRKACWAEFKVQGRQVDQLKAEVDSLTREADRQYTTIETYRKDADRFRWLLKNASVILDKKTAYQAETGFIKFDTMPGRTETESAIDAAMSKGVQS